jgi:beclin 1
LCAECTHILLSTLTRQLDEIKKERDGYIAFEREAKKEKEREKDGLAPQEAQRKITRLKEDERSAVEKLREAEREREQLAEELRSLELEEKALEEEEEECAFYNFLLSLSSKRFHTDSGVLTMPTY